jgi:hypothetical protein
MVPVEKASDKYYIFDKAEWFRDTAKKRAPGTASDRHGFTLSNDNYFCEEYTEATTLTNEDRANADSILNLEAEKARFVTEKILLRYEIDVAALCTTNTNWGTNYSTPTYAWDDYDNSDPLIDIENAKDQIEGNTGQPVNKMIIAYDVWKALKHHPALLERMPSTALKSASIDLLRNLTEIQEIHVAGGIKNTSASGATASYSRIWTEDVWMGHVASGPAKATPTALYGFVWPYSTQEDSSKIANMGNKGIRGIRRWRDENIHSDVIEGYMNYDLKVVGTDLGYLLENVI